MRKRRILNNRGDTIVEVMLALVVMSVAIGVSYGVANRSLKGMRIAQERGEATKIAESQAERLKKIKQDEVATPAGPFCLYQLGAALNTVKPFAANSAPQECAFSDASTSNNPNNRYHVEITESTPNSNRFEIRVWWEGLAGNREFVKINYLLL